MQTTLRLIFLLLLAVTLISCGKVTPESLRADATRARDDAKSAYESKQPKKAIKAADRAQDLAKKAYKLADAGKFPEEEKQKLPAELATLAREARLYARLAEQEDQLRRRLGSLKLRAYGGARNFAVTTIFKSFEPAASKAALQGVGSLSAVDQETAYIALRFSTYLASRQPLPNGSLDWTSAAADMKAWSSNPPPNLAQLLAIGFAAATLEDFALHEIESVDVTKLTGKNEASFYHILRGIICMVHGWDELAVREFDASVKDDPQKNDSTGKIIAGVARAFLAFVALDKDDYAKADLEISRMNQIWPDNPLAVFLTGEQLAANGEYTRAAESLEQSAANTKYEWHARRLSERARQIRDQQGEAKPLLYDKAFMFEILTHTLAEAAKDSQPMLHLKNATDSAKDFTKRMLSHIPGMSEKNAGTTSSETPVENSATQTSP